jgi:catechol 2,3-dioxygenase-like lactoylglutathione lyase family enzyme
MDKPAVYSAVFEEAGVRHVTNVQARAAVTGAIVVSMLCVRVLDAQLFPAGDAVMTMGHVLLNVSDVAAHREFWTRQFDAKPVRVGTLEGVTIPGVVVLFRVQPPAGPSEGTVINHMGLKLNTLANFTARFDKAGLKYDPPRIGREKTPQTYVTGPDGFRMELVEDPRIPAPAVSHHLHYWLEQPLEVKKWYVQKLLLTPTMRGPYESGDVPGMNLTLAPLGSQKGAGVPMKGRLMDSIGFDVPNLKTYVDKIAANGVTFDVPYGRDPELGLMTATVTDPWGATIRLTEGLHTIAGVTPYTYTDGYVVVRPLD